METERIKFVADMQSYQKSLDKANLNLQKQKDKINEINKAIKELGKESGARKDLILIRAEEERKLKATKEEIKQINKEIQGVGEQSKKTGLSFKKMAFLMTAAAGAGAGLAEFFRYLFKNSEVFQLLGYGLEKFGKTLGTVIDAGMRPFISGIKSIKDIKLEKEFDKIRKSAVENIAEFETLAYQAEVLASTMQPTNKEQREYARTIEALKKMHPEHLGNLKAEVKSHKENAIELAKVNDLLFNQVVLEMSKKEVIELNKELAIARMDLKKASDQEATASENNADVLKRNNDAYLEAIRAKSEARQSEVVDAADAIKKQGLIQDESNEIDSKHLIVIDQVQSASRKLTDAENERISAQQKVEEITKKITEAQQKYRDILLETISGSPEGKATEEEEKAAEKQQKITLERLATYEEYLRTKLAAEKAFQASRQDGELQFSQFLKDQNELNIIEWIQKNQKMAEWSLQQAQQVGAIFSQMNATEMQEIEQKYDREKELLEDKYAAGTISKEKYERDLKKIEQKAEKEKTAALKKQQKIDIAMATAQTAINVLQAFGGKDNVLTWQMWTQAALAAALGAAQIGTIAAQEFADGGSFDMFANKASENLVVSDRATGAPVGLMNSREPIMTEGVAKNPALYSAASAINVAGGGRAFPGAGAVQSQQINAQLNASSSINMQELTFSVLANINNMKNSGVDTDAV